MKTALNVIRAAFVCNLVILCRIEKVFSHHAKVNHRVWQQIRTCMPFLNAVVIS